MLSRNRASDHDTDEESGGGLLGGGDKPSAKRSVNASASPVNAAGMWSRAPMWAKIVFVFAIGAGVLLAVRHFLHGASFEAERNAERASEAASLKTLSPDVLTPLLSQPAGGKKVHKQPFNPQTGRRVFIDAGCQDGESLTLFTEHAHVGADWDIYAFDASPEYAAHWDGLHKSAVFPHLTYYPLAVWDKNQTLTFALKGGESTAIANSQINSEHVEGVDGMTKVSGIDFDEWLHRHVTADDWVVLKMNVRGAEFPVLKRLVESGNIQLIDQLYLECHYYSLTKLFEHITEDTCQALCEQIVPYDVQFFFWSRVHPSDGHQTGFQYLDTYAVQGDDCRVLTNSALTPVVDGRHSGHVTHHESFDAPAQHSAQHTAQHEISGSMHDAELVEEGAALHHESAPSPAAHEPVAVHEMEHEQSAVHHPTTAVDSAHHTMTSPGSAHAPAMHWGDEQSTHHSEDHSSHASTEHIPFADVSHDGPHPPQPHDAHTAPVHHTEAPVHHTEAPVHHTEAPAHHTEAPVQHNFDHSAAPIHHTEPHLIVPPASSHDTAHDAAAHDTHTPAVVHDTHQPPTPEHHELGSKTHLLAGELHHVSDHSDESESSHGESHHTGSTSEDDVDPAVAHERAQVLAQEMAELSNQLKKAQADGHALDEEERREAADATIAHHPSSIAGHDMPTRAELFDALETEEEALSTDSDDEY